MRVPYLNSCVALFLAVLSFYPASAQLTTAEKTTAIQTIAKHIAENYVDQSMGGQISSHLLMANHKGEFKKASTWQQFNDQVTQSMQKFSGDPHLYLRYDPALVQQLKSASANAQEMNVGEVFVNNYGFADTRIVGDNVGYLKLSAIQINEQSVAMLHEAMAKFANTRALIIDLRDNPGGASKLGPVLESYFLPANTPLLEFMSRAGTTSIDSTLNGFDKPRYDYENPVYILINNKTASAAEAFTFVMKHHKRARIVGEKSAGAANRNEWFVVNDQNYVSVSTAATYLAGTQITWEREGIQPDYRTKSDALEYTLGSLLKK